MRQSNQYQRVRLSTIYSRYFDLYLADPKHPVSKETFKAVNQTIACRTSRIGVNIYECPECHEKKYVLRSCKNRFCPQCGYADTKKWASGMLDKIADCGHHHIVFTLPGSLRSLSKQNKDKVHSLLLKTSSETILDWFKAKYKLTPGIMNVLHTAGSDQKYHPHAHMLCSAGGLNDTDQFNELPVNWYLVNQKFLAKKFRWHFEKGLFSLYNKNELSSPFENVIAFKQFIKQVNQQDWVVSIQPPLKKADDIVNYVGRYTKRACISEYNILSADDGIITIRHKDYKHTNASGKPSKSELALGYRDFFGRLFEHVPSKGFRMVRYYGMYSSRIIGQQKQVKGHKTSQIEKPGWREYQIHKTGIDPLICPCCKKEMMLIQEYYDRRTRWQRAQRKDKIPHCWAVAV
jgi:hypothetical protein